MEDELYDLCIIGAGMFGSAAARHASANAKTKICLIGPEEPAKECFSQREIFGAHYDEGRISRVLDNDPAYQIMAKQSISRYREIEELSGILFYKPVGSLFISKKNSSFTEETIDVARMRKLPIVDISDKDVLKKRYPFLQLKPDDQVILDENGSGYISPRKMVEAQKKIARLQGCHIINDIVNEVSELADGFHKIMTEGNLSIKARRVLFCTGAFTNFKKFPLPLLNIVVNKETAALLRIPASEAERISSMPTIIYRRIEEGIHLYILPPIQYPDGHYYLKIGHMETEGLQLGTLDQIKNWYLSKGDQEFVKFFSEFLIGMLPGIEVEEISSLTCASCDSPTGRPYIDRVTPTITVAAVGNGKGAKIAEEVGRVAAHLSLEGKWDSEVTQAQFSIILDDSGYVN